DARHVVEELVGGVGPEIRPLDFLARQLDQPAEVVRAVVDDAQEPRREARIAAGLGFGRALQHEHALGRLACRKRCAQGGVAGADDDDVPGLHHSTLTFAFCTTSFQRACSLAMKSANSFGVEPTGCALSGSICFSTAELFA